MAKAAGLGKTIHTADAADVYPSIGCGLLVESIFLNDFLRNVAEFDFCKFGSFEWCHEVEICKVDAHKLRARCGNYTVEEYLDKEERGRVGANVVGIVDEVAAHGCTRAVGFLLFRVNGANKLYVGNIFEAVTGDLSFGYELNCVGSLYSFPYTLRKASEFIGSGGAPSFFEFGVPEELLVF